MQSGVSVRWLILVKYWDFCLESFAVGDNMLSPRSFLFGIGKSCFPRGELMAVTGKAKSSKTFFTSMLMADGVEGICRQAGCSNSTCL